MTAPATSPRPQPRPDNLSGDGFSDGGDGPGNIVLERPLTEDELLALGVDPNAVDEQVRSVLSDILIESSDASLRGIGNALRAAGSIGQALDILSEADEIFDFESNGSLGGPELTINFRELNETMISTALSVVSFGFTDMVTIGDQSAGDHLGMLTNDSLDMIGAEFGSFSHDFMRNLTNGLIQSGIQNRPVIIDLDADGVEFATSAGVFYDVDGDGFSELTSWVDSGDGFLVFDMDGDGDITDARELSFARFHQDYEMLEADGDEETRITDLQGLAEARDENNNLIFDTNDDGVLNASDSLWTSFYIWQDTNANGVSEDGELTSLSEITIVVDSETGETSTGIDSITLDYDFDETADDTSVFGSTLFGMTNLTSGQHSLSAVGDVGW